MINSSKKYIPVIGLEIHTELKTNSKMFCGCKNDSQEKEANLNICPVCMGHPGTLPVINETAIRFVIKTGIALNCKIAKESRFERKNYFYPDLPKGYQISQYKEPFCFNGFLKINNKKIRIRRVHLEEDTARLIHSKNGYSLIDFNRAGIPLMELVTEPDIESFKEASDFAKKLQLILRYLEVSSADMEKGQLRVEANISLINANFKAKDAKLGTKVEIKNLNSFRAVERAIEYEIARQKELLLNDEKVVQETRGWDPQSERTFPQREKEEAHDYRYFPEPDLPPIYIKKDYLEAIKKGIPELPDEKMQRLKEEFSVNEQSARILVSNRDLSEYFEKSASELLRWSKDKRLDQESQKALIQSAANYLLTDLLGCLSGKEFSEKDFPITPENFGEFIALVRDKKFTSKMAKILLGEMFDSGQDPSTIIKKRGLIQTDNEDEIKKIVQKIISSNPAAVSDYKKGKENALQFMIGQMMKETKGTINPEIAKKLLNDYLK